MDKETSEQLELVEMSEPTLGLAKGFFRKLLTAEDDWSFVIKTHALLESSLTRVIQTTILPEALREFVTTFDLCGGRHSKVELLRSCDLLEDEEAKVVRGLSKIRNRLVHNIRYTSFDLSTYLESASSKEREDFVRITCCLFSDHEDHERAERSREKILAKPKLYLWLSALHVTAMAELRTRTAEANGKIEILEREILEQKIEQLQRVIASTDAFSERPDDRPNTYNAFLSRLQENRQRSTPAD